MQLRITKSRAAIAALFVLAGVGLGSLLSPLVGTALATAGQIVNISDRSGSAFFANVTSAGELKTNGVVSGKVAPALPPQPFSVNRLLSNGLVFLGPTTATVALTDLSFTNHFGNQGRNLVLAQNSGPAPNTNCANNRQRIVGVYNVSTSQTVVQDFVTPIVLKPLASGDAWCVLVSLGAPAGDANFAVNLMLGGYVLSGTFAP